MSDLAADGKSVLEAPEATREPDTGAAGVPMAARRFNTRGRTLRAWAARGVLVNTTFNVALSGLGLLRGFVLAVFLTRFDYGVWGALAVSLGVLAGLKLVGIDDKYIQQNDEDQELAFQHAFTMELIATALVAIPLIAALPVIAIAYGHWSLIAPGVVLLLALPAGALQAPLWTYYRHMEFTRARTIQALDPVVSFLVTLALAIAGAGYWALVVGVVAGAWSAAIAAVLKSPYRLRWRYQSGVLKVYRAYSWPLFVTSATAIVVANAATLATNVSVGLAGVGVVALAASITQFTNRVDDIVSGTLYPAICAVQDRLDLLRESFEKSNRLALIWAVPFGVGVALFSSDLVHYVLGTRWLPAIGLLQITGIVAAVGHIGFNWDDYFRAEADTKPIAVAAVGTMIAFLAVAVPLTLADGLRGLAIGIGVQVFVHVAFRAYYLARMFHGFDFLRHASRAILPTVPGAALVLLARAVESGPRSAAVATAEISAFVLVTAVSTWWLEGRLLREALGYVAGRRTAGVTAA